MKGIQYIKTKWNEIKIIDQYLIIIMIILILYSVSTIFVNISTNQNTTSIDIVMRTTIASIFGYFISSNFVKNEGEGTKQPLGNTITTGTATVTSKASSNVPENPVGKIGFIIDETETSGKDAPTDALGQGTTAENTDKIASFPTNHLQISIIGALCICAILVLICARYGITVTNEKISTVSQFRDILCGSVGFLIGMPTDK